jgi:hypothetical protein
MDNNKNALLRYLNEMQPAVIYALADKVHLFNGFELCKRTPVSDLHWSDDGERLTVKLSDGDTVHVALTLSQGQLTTSCDCGLWSPRGRCPHVVATLATLKKAVSHASFPMLQLPGAYLEKIRSQIPSLPQRQAPVAAPLETDGRYALLIERNETGVRMRLLQDRVPVTLFDPGLPPPIREFVRVMYSSATRGKFIEEFLARFGAQAPIIYAAPDGKFPLTFDAVAVRSVLLRVDLRQGEVKVGRVLDDGTDVDESMMVSEDYLFDLRRRRIQRIGSGVGRFIKKLLYGMQVVPHPEFVPESGGFSTSVHSFNLAQFSLTYPEFPQFLHRAKLCVGGEPARPRSAEPRYRLNIIDLGTERAELVGEGVAEGAVFEISREVFWFFAPGGRVRFPQPLKAKKRVQAIIRACFATLAGKTRTEKEKIMRLALNGPDFAKRGVKSEARKVISSFWQVASEPRLLLQVAGGEWVTIGVSAEEEARLLAIPYQLFGPEIFLASERLGGVSVDRKLLMKELPRLRDELESAGFSLAVGGEELETVSWSFTLDATHSTIDWFELRPEIRFEGELVDERELREAMQGGGLFRKGNKMMVLDEQSSHALSLFSSTGKREVVRVPRLQILDWITLRRNGVRVLLSPEDERIIESLTNFERIPKRDVPAPLHAVLRNYQRDGYNWLGFLYEHRFGACLADDMGLGKTIQAIALIAGLKEGLIASDIASGVPHLVVVPPSLIFNWESEIARFYPGLRVGVYRGQGRRADFSGLDLVLTSYGVIQRDIEILGLLQFNVIVFDEAQAVKNIHAETTGAVRKLKGRFKLTLTGTPVENHLGEYFSVMDLAVPGLLGPYEQFRRQMGREGTGFLETLIRRTHPFIMRRTKDMIADELPPKVETDIYLEMSPRQKALYVRTVAQVKSTVAEAYRSNAPGQARIIALTAILKLRQICLSSRLLLAGATDRSPKIDFLVERLQELFDEGHSVLVFSQFTSFLDVVQDGLNHSGISFLRLDGSTPVAQRKDLVQRFQESSQPSAFLLSLKAGGRGLNLTRASYVFHLDPWWNPAVENQASDRAHRIGQQRQVTITRLLMRHSIEEKMMELKKRKLKLYRALLEDAEHGGAESIGREDFEFLLG